MVTTIQKFTLVKINKPITENKVILKDANSGGMRLRYKVQTIERSKKKLFLGLITKNVNKVLSEKETSFLKPYKKNWFGKASKSIPKHERGSSNSPYAGVWLETFSEYEDWEKEKAFLFLKFEHVKDHRLIAFLNKEKKNFILVQPKVEEDVNGFKTIKRNV